MFSLSHASFLPKSCRRPAKIVKPVERPAARLPRFPDFPRPYRRPQLTLTCLSLWYLRNFYRKEFVPMTKVEPVHNVYDLTDIDFSTGFVRLQGDLEYIPGILTPEEFAACADEAAPGPLLGG